MNKVNFNKKGQIGLGSTLLNHSALTDEQLIHEKNELELSIRIREEARLGRESLKNEKIYSIDEMKEKYLQ